MSSKVCESLYVWKATSGARIFRFPVLRSDRGLGPARQQGSRLSHVYIAFYATCNWHTCSMIYVESLYTWELSTSFPFSSVKGCCERGSKRTKHRATVVSFYTTRNLRTSVIMIRDKPNSLVLCVRHHVAHGTDLRHIRFQFRCTSILVRIVDSVPW